MIRKCRLLVNTKVISNIINLQQNRTATVLRRVHKPPLMTKGECASGKIAQKDLDINGIPKFFDGSSEELKPDPWYLRYEVIEEDADAELPPVKLILMRSMEDFGRRGQVVTIPAEKAHKELLLPRLAVYASTQNLEKYANIVIAEDSVQYSSETTQRKLPDLSKVVVPIVMSGDQSEPPWSVEPWHIKIGLRKYAGIYLESDGNIILDPKKQIHGPNSSLHGKEFLVRIVINEMEEVPIRCILYQAAESKDISEEDVYGLEDVAEVPPRSWKITFNEPIFEDEREHLYVLPRHPLPEVVANERLNIKAAAEYKMDLSEIRNLHEKYSEWKDKRDKVLFS